MDYGRDHPIKGGSLHPRKLRSTFIEMLLAHLCISKKFRIHKLTPSLRKNDFKKFYLYKKFFKKLGGSVA